MAMTPFGYYAVSQNSAGYNSPQAATEGLCGSKCEASQTESPYLQNTGFQSGFLTQVQPHHVIQAPQRMPSVHAPFGLDNGERSSEGDRMSWQLAYDRYHQGPAQIFPNQFPSPVLLGPIPGTSSTPAPAYPNDRSHSSPVETFGRTTQNASPSLGDLSLSG